MLRICELTLAGFGVYKQPTRFLLPADGSAIFWGSNETGKSTFLWAVAAVWFGLPKSSDRSKIGTQRFHSFGQPGEFWGEIVWEHEGRRFRLHRDFDLQRVRLLEETVEGERILFEGEHNPQGRTSTGSAFAQHLRERLGLSQLELYLETFCLSQPLTGDDTIGQELQHLISGSRATKIDDVLTRVWNQVKELTRATGDLGIARPGTNRPTNQRDAGRIERLEMTLAQSRVDEKQARAQLEKLNENNEALEAAQNEVETIRKRQEDRQGRLSALQKWTKDNKDRVRRTERLSQLDHALGEYDRLRGECESLEARIKKEHAPFAAAPENLTQLLEAVEKAGEDHDRLQTRQAEWSQDKDKREQEIVELEEELETTFAEVRGRSDWVETRRKLIEARARRDTKKGEVDALRKEVARRERDLEASETLDSFAVEACEAHADLLTEGFKRIERIEAKLESLDGKLEERDFLETDDRLAQLREKIELEHELRECSILVREKKADALEARAHEAEESVRESRRPLDRDPDSASDDESRSAEADAHGTGAQMQPARATWPFGLIAAASIAVALHFGLMWSWVFAGAVGIALFSVWFLIDHQRTGQKGPRQAGDRLSPGQRLRQRLRETKPELDGDGDDDAPSPTSPAIAAADELEQLQQRQHEMEDRLEVIREALGPYATTNQAQLAAMEERWRMVEEQVEGLCSERSELLESRFGAGDEDGWRDLPVAESDEYVERLLLLPGGPTPEENPRVIDLLKWLQTLDQDDWNAFKEAEAARDQAVHELDALRQRHVQCKTEASDQTEILLLEKKLAPFTMETDPKELLRLTEDCQDAERKLQNLKDRVAEFSGEKFSQQLEASEEAIEKAWETLGEAWTCDRPDPERLAAWAKETRGAAGPARDAAKKLAGLEDACESLLRSSLFKSRDELVKARSEEDAALGQIVRELEALEESELALATEEDDPSADRAARLGQLRESEERADRADRISLETAEEEVRRLLRGMASLEGKPIPNLASLELAIRQREEEIDEAASERDALTLAFQWMEEAAETYQGTYRETLEHRITRHFRDLTESDRAVEVTEKFELLVRDGQGRELCLDQLSQGTRDQLLLSIRLGVADLLSGSVPLPFFFDDAFVHFDETRLSLAKKTLDSLGRQWILLTHRRDLSGWADPIFTTDPYEQDAKPVPVGAVTSTADGTASPSVPAADKSTKKSKLTAVPRRRSTDRGRRRRKKKKKSEPIREDQGSLDFTDGEPGGKDDRRSGTDDR